jgi:hypothetical protein
MGTTVDSLLSSNAGSLSTTRLSFLLCTFLSNIVVFLIWGSLCIWNVRILEIPESVIFLYCLANGITFTGKMVQKNMEITNGKGEGAK